MTEIEKALKAWFVSQGIDQPEAMRIMYQFVAHEIAKCARDDADLDLGIAQVCAALSVEAVRYREERKGVNSK